MIETFADSRASNEDDFGRLVDAVAFSDDPLMEIVYDYASKLDLETKCLGFPPLENLYIRGDEVIFADGNADLMGMGEENHGMEVKSFETISASAGSADIVSVSRNESAGTKFELVQNRTRQDDVTSFFDIQVNVVENDGPTAVGGMDNLKNDGSTFVLGLCGSLVGIVTLYLAVVCYCIETSDDLMPISAKRAPEPRPNVITIIRVEDTA